MTNPVEAIGQKLQQVEGDGMALKGQVWTLFRQEAELLATIDQVEAAQALQGWIAHYPSAIQLLLRAVEKLPPLPLHLTPVLLRSQTLIQNAPHIHERVQDVLCVALPHLSPGLLSVVFDQYPTLRSPRFREGQSYVALPPDGEPDWPHDKNFPALSTIEGRQARLRYLGHPLHDPPGTWGTSSEAALIRYQIEQELPHLGTWNEALARTLDEEAIGKMCMYRDDPSELFD